MGNTIRNNRMIDKHARRLVPSKYNHTEDRSFMYEWKSSSQKNKNIVLGNGIVRQKRLLTYPRKVLHVHKNDTVRRKQLLTYPRKSSLQKYKNSVVVYKNDTTKRKRLLTYPRKSLLLKYKNSLLVHRAVWKKQLLTYPRKNSLQKYK